MTEIRQKKINDDLFLLYSIWFVSFALLCFDSIRYGLVWFYLIDIKAISIFRSIYFSSILFCSDGLLQLLLMLLLDTIVVCCWMWLVVIQYQKTGWILWIERSVLYVDNAVLVFSFHRFATLLGILKERKKTHTHWRQVEKNLSFFFCTREIQQ